MIDVMKLYREFPVGHNWLKRCLEHIAAEAIASARPEALRREIVAWRAHTDNGKQHLIWRSEGDEDWLRKHYVRWDALYAHTGERRSGQAAWCKEHKCPIHYCNHDRRQTVPSPLGK